MRQVSGLISTYSSDEFGICSALFELGGMVVMHDASGCNSTYTTHDEPRWYDMDSMIYISAISEAEAIMGDDDKFIVDLIETAQKLQPEFIALVGAPIPYMIGTDLDAIAEIVSHETGIPCFGFPANGMHAYTRGVSMAMKKITELFACRGKQEHASGEDKGKESDVVPEKGCAAVNLLGVTPLDFSMNGSVDSMRRWIERNGMKNGVCLSVGCDLEAVKRLGEADVNLVVSYGGLEAARVLEERFGIPYVAGVPFGEAFSARLAAMLKQAAAAGVNYCGYKMKENSDREPMSGETGQQAEKIPGCLQKEGFPEGKKTVIIGESVFCCSLAEAVEQDTGIPVQVLCPLDTEEWLLRDGDRETPEEDDLIRELEQAEAVIADPLYRSLVEEHRFYELPHEAFSGRIYERKNPDLIAEKISTAGCRGYNGNP